MHSYTIKSPKIEASIYSCAGWFVTDQHVSKSTKTRVCATWKICCIVKVNINHRQFEFE